MNIKELKLKENITLANKVNVIEDTVNICFTIGESMNVRYTPYYKDIVFVAECLRNFFDENEYEIDDVESDYEIYDYIMKNGLYYTLLNELRKNDVLDYIQYSIEEKIAFEKQRIILVEQNGILSMVSDKLYDIAVNEDIRIQKEIEALDKMNSLTNTVGEQLAFQEKVNELLPAEKQVELAEKLGDKDFGMNEVVESTIRQMVEDGHFDSKAKEIIDSKNQEIIDKKAEIISLQEALKKVCQNGISDRG
jgi:hypothetical protein